MSDLTIVKQNNVALKAEALNFGSTTAPYFQLSPYFAAPLFLDNIIWPSSEHYYHAQKFHKQPLEERIRQAKDPHEAFALSHGQEAVKAVRSDWDNVKLHIMQKAVVAKFTQHPDLRQLLLSTGKRNLIYDSLDEFWGCGPTKLGKNHLGNILTIVRVQLLAEITPEIADPTLHGAPAAPLTPGQKPEKVTLEGKKIRLVPLDIDKHADELYKASHEKPDLVWSWVYSGGPFASVEDLKNYLRRYDTMAASVPWVIVDKDTSKLVGCYNLIAVDAVNRRLEVGGIWYSPEFQRTYANTETNLLALQYCFETLQYRRIEWKTHHNNTRSQAAAIRLGFTFEGKFRQHLIHKGTSRDSMYYSMLDSEWPAAKANLIQKLAAILDKSASK